MAGNQDRYDLDIPVPIMMVLDEGDVPHEPVRTSPSEVPVFDTSSVELEYPHTWMKVKLDQIIQKHMKAHDQSTRRPAQEATSIRSVAEEPREAKEKTKDPKEVLREFVNKFQHRASPKPKYVYHKVPLGTLIPEAKHFTLGTPPVTPTRTLTSPPGLGTREYPILSPKVPPRHEEKVIPQNHRALIIKNN